ncbi:hypothetical protein ILUMI_17489 [Ignelater luminosus]|uniref:MADF domain-containing protein n=1 Tax=Ignelater luminosus TaxID=2038154 RepID=A0A8K0CJS1_IGNLU|nr:hypothetical protein ILUMI_17489 [Ignelater luminosus]
MIDNTKIEEFIEIVRRHTILYNMSHPCYKNIKKKDMIWDDIAKTVGGNDDNTDQVDHGEQEKRSQQVNINSESVPQEPPATTRKRKSEETTLRSSSVEQVIQYLEN